MAWQFYGFMHPVFSRYVHGRLGKSEVCGPLPCKRWVKHPSDPKQHKLSRKAHGPRPASPSVKSQAEAYARWLAARDGITIPSDTIAKAQYADVTAPNSKGRMAYQSRPFMVQFCKAAPSGRYGEQRLGDALVTINLPNWDWVPEMTEEHETEDMQLAA